MVPHTHGKGKKSELHLEKEQHIFGEELKEGKEVLRGGEGR